MQTARNATDGAIDTKYPTKRISLDYHDELEDSTEHVEQALMRPAGYMVGAYDFPCFLRFPAASLNTPEDPFHRLAELLQSSNRIFVLLGAGLSASSGMETFGPTAKRWRGLSPDYFRATWSLREDLTVMWWFFSDRMKKAQEAEPSRGHQALAHLARQRKDFLAVDVTFDGLCQRAGFPEDRIVHVQGTMFEMKCEKNVLERNDRCNYSSPVTYPVNAGFTIPDGSDISDARVPLPPVTHDQLPHCPICVSHMRPAISFRGENGYKEQRQRAHSFLSAERTDLMLVVGTTGKMIASAHYITRARARGAKIVYVNLPGYKGPNELCKVQDSDWVLEGDAAKTLPEWFKSVSQTT